jgi:hypothetical protein
MAGASPIRTRFRRHWADRGEPRSPIYLRACPGRRHASEDRQASTRRSSPPRPSPAVANALARARAKREVMPGIEHRQHKGLNNRAENSHQPTRRRFKSAGQAQRFLSAHDQINNLFYLRRDHVTAAEHRASRTQRFHIWAEICSIGWQGSLGHLPGHLNMADTTRQVDGAAANGSVYFVGDLRFGSRFAPRRGHFRREAPLPRRLTPLC